MEEKRLKDEELISITNRNFSAIGYTIPELNRSRDFGPGMTKKVSMGELRALLQAPGGYQMLKKYIVIHNEEALDELLGSVEPEYYYSAKDVDYLLMSGSLEQLEDALDWAPGGVVELIKSRAVELRLPDRNKIKAIADKTGFNLEAAIRNKDAFKDLEEEAPVEKKRRTTAIKAEEAPAAKPKRQSKPLEVSKEIPEAVDEDEEVPVVENKYSIG